MEDVQAIGMLEGRAANVQRRLVRAAMAASETEPQEARPATVTLGSQSQLTHWEQLHRLGHTLRKLSGGCWECTQCHQYAIIAHQGRASWIRHGACRPRLSGSGSLFFLGSGTAHPSHLLEWQPVAEGPRYRSIDAEQGYWRCQRCGLYGQRKLVGLRSPCRPRREKKTWRRGHDAGRKPPAARREPPAASSQGPSEGSKLANLLTRVRLRQSSRAQDAAPR